jgi:isoleucyl-tRNA synthetase
MGDWEGHWKTMDESFELRQLAVFKALASRDLVYRKHKLVYWSPSSLSALAEAELEYEEDYVSAAALVIFPLAKNTSFKPLADITPTLHTVIWTTTP